MSKMKRFGSFHFGAILRKKQFELYFGDHKRAYCISFPIIIREIKKRITRYCLGEKEKA
jgi:hypothetical protein